MVFLVPSLLHFASGQGCSEVLMRGGALVLAASAGGFFEPRTSALACLQGGGDLVSVFGFCFTLSPFTCWGRRQCLGWRSLSRALWMRQPAALGGHALGGRALGGRALGGRALGGRVLGGHTVRVKISHGCKALDVGTVCYNSTTCPI